MSFTDAWPWVLSLLMLLDLVRSRRQRLEIHRYLLAERERIRRDLARRA